MKNNMEMKIREFHQARWNELIITEMSVPGERGVLVPRAEEEVVREVGNGVGVLGDLARKSAPDLPEISQVRVNRHYIRLSQENFGADNTLQISQGTCTMKYSPKVQEHFAARSADLCAIHPLQDQETIQGILEVYYKTAEFMAEISGLDKVSFQPSGGANAIDANASVIRAYHQAQGDHNRTEIITTMHSHPAVPGACSMNGYKIITLMPSENGLPDIEEFKAALSENTAAIFVTNPEDTGLYNSQIKEFTKAAHEVGALCAYDQANANALLGIARAREAGFDLSHFNLHKTFSGPHASAGPGCGAMAVKEFLTPFLPKPTVEFDGAKYYLDDNRPQSIGRVRSFLGHVQIVLRVYMWCMQLGAKGLKEASVISVLNNQYMTKKILEEVPGVSLYFDKGQRRMEQTRFSFEKLMEDTGFGIGDVNRRLVDFAIPEIWESHHPHTVPEPFTPEPCESYSKEDIDYYVAVIKHVAKECYENPEIIKTAPHNVASHMPTIDAQEFEEVATTWRQYKKKFLNK